MKRIWEYLTDKEISSALGQIEGMCYEQGYDVNEGLSLFYEHDLKGSKSPARSVNGWINFVLSRKLEKLKEEAESEQDYMPPPPLSLLFV